MVSSALILSVASFFTQSDMNLTFDMPTEVVAGESFILNIDVDKGDISNFAKLQLNFPEGFSAELLEGQEGTFTFYDQKMKLIWISLPSDSKFQVKVKINTDKSITGDFNFNGKISFVFDGERKSKDLVTPRFNISPNAKSTEPGKTAAATKPAGTSGTSINVGSKETEMSCSRSFDATQIAPGETFLIELKIKKSNVSGFGKIVENLPEGFTAREVEANGALFSQKGSEVKFLWMTLPADDEFTVSYKVMVDDNLTGNKVIDGKMSYLEGSDKKFSLIDGTSIEINEAPSTTAPPVTTPPAGGNNNTPPVEDKKPPVEATKPPVEDKKPPVDNTPPTDDNLASNHQVNYRVQICALRKQVPTEHFVKNHNVQEHIYLNMHEGWHKYTVGDFKKYMDAREHRGVASSDYKIKGPFVTAYNNGSRITVQEALMITKDEWVAP